MDYTDIRFELGDGVAVVTLHRPETLLHHHLMGRADAVEGAVAYLERRPPRWTLSVTRDRPEWPGGSSEGGAS